MTGESENLFEGENKMSSILWNNEDPIKDLGIEIPRWIEDDISPSDVAAIVQGGCDSGAYMPAVTYWQASKTMEQYGDDVLDYIEDSLGEIPNPDMKDMSWSGLACYFLSYAVELWAGSVEDELVEILEALEDEETP